LDAAVASITTFDGSTAVGSTIEALSARRTALEAVESTGENAAALQAEKEALDNAIQAATSLAEAEQAAAEAEAKAVAEAVGTDDTALQAALLSAANPNRVQEYGKEDYVDAEVMGWAKSVLGVGDLDGKIDQMKEMMELQSVPDEPI
jgi:hypothetical protein